MHSDLYRKRADLIGFVNGIPLVFIELKASHRNLKHAYDDNLRDYRDTIPHLFIPNGFIDPLERRGDEGWDDHLRLGVLLRVEEDQLRR